MIKSPQLTIRLAIRAMPRPAYLRPNKEGVVRVIALSEHFRCLEFRLRRIYSAAIHKLKGGIMHSTQMIVCGVDVRLWVGQ